MEVSIKGGTKSQKAYAKSIIEFCADKLMSTRLANTLTVKLHFTPLYEKHRQMGNCSCLESLRKTVLAVTSKILKYSKLKKK